jgi:hypothetical protein
MLLLCLSNFGGESSVRSRNLVHGPVFTPKNRRNKWLKKVFTEKGEEEEFDRTGYFGKYGKVL